MTEDKKPRLNLNMDDAMRCHDALLGKMKEWAETKQPDEFKRVWIIGYQETAQKFEAYLRAKQETKNED